MNRYLYQTNPKPFFFLPEMRFKKKPQYIHNDPFDDITLFVKIDSPGHTSHGLWAVNRTYGLQVSENILRDRYEQI